MTSIVLTSTSGPDGKLHLDVPVGQPDTEFEVQITARPKSARANCLQTTSSSSARLMTKPLCVRRKASCRLPWSWNDVPSGHECLGGVAP